MAAGSPHGPPSFAFDPVRTAAWRLLDKAGADARLVAACAPPGYGKTVLLAGLFHAWTERGLRCLWLTLDDRDRDVGALLQRLQCCVDPAGMPLPPPLPALQEQSSTIDRVVQWAAALDQPTVLFIDNVGYCHDPALAPLLERLLFGRATQLQLVLSSTRELPVDMVRAKLELRALEIGVRHLGFDRAATDQLMRQAGISGLDAGELDRIVRQTEGWAAALRLLQVLLVTEDEQGTATPRAVLSRFSGDHQDIARVLTRRVLVGFEPALVTFMVELSMLREFNAELAQHVTGHREAGDWLAMLVQRNVLTFPLDSSRRWFRFHTLLREFLLAEAGERLTTGRRHEVLRRAAAWHHDRHDLATAIDLALQAPEREMAVDMLDRIANVTVGDQGNMGRFIGWVDQLARLGVEPTPEAHAWFVWALCDTLQFERALKAMEAFDLRIARDPTLAGTRAHRRLQFVRLVFNVFVDRLDSNLELAQAWLDEQLSEEPMTQATVVSIAAISEIDAGDHVAAGLRLEEARAAIERSDSGYGLAWVHVLQAMAALGQARPDRAHELLSEGRLRVVQAIGPDAAVLVTLDLVHARALVDLGSDVEARALIERALPRAGEHGFVRTLEAGLSASLSVMAVDDASAAATLALIDRAATAHPPRAQQLLAASKVRWLLQRGQVGEARAQAERHGIAGAVSSMGLAHGDRLLAEMEMLLAQGRGEDVLSRVDGLMRQAQQHGRERDRVELLLLACDALLQQGQARRAVRQFAMAVALATPGRLLQPFRVRAALVQAMVAAAGEPELSLVLESQREFFSRVRAVVELRTPARPAAVETAATGAVLTLRQREMLMLLDEGLGSEELANRLGLTLPTVKWHLHRLYVAMGVKGRVPALARARALGLVRR